MYFHLKCWLSQQRNIKRKREASCQESLQWLEDGYVPAKLVMTNSRMGEVQEVMLREEETSVEDDVDRLNMVLYLKDKHNISGI